MQTWQSWYLVGPLNTGSHVSLFTNFSFPKFSPVFFPIVFPQCCIGQLVGVHSRPLIYGKLAVFLVSCFSQCFPYHLSPKISPGVFPIVFFSQCCIGQLVGVLSRPQIYGKLARPAGTRHKHPIRIHPTPLRIHLHSCNENENKIKFRNFSHNAEQRTCKIPIQSGNYHELLHITKVSWKIPNYVLIVRRWDHFNSMIPDLWETPSHLVSERDTRETPDRHVGDTLGTPGRLLKDSWGTQIGDRWVIHLPSFNWHVTCL